MGRVNALFINVDINHSVLVQVVSRSSANKVSASTALSELAICLFDRFILWIFLTSDTPSAHPRISKEELAYLSRAIGMSRSVDRGLQ